MDRRNQEERRGETFEEGASVAADLPPLVWLRAFEASARHTSFTAAAAELHLTQAAVSHQVRSLERHLGVTLFERLPRNLRLTEIGTAYLPPLRRSFDDLAAATAGLFGPSGRRSLLVRAPVSFASLWLAVRLPRFLAAHPNVALRIASVVWAHAPADEIADIDIRFGDGIWPGCRAEMVRNFGAVVVCRPDMVPNGASAERIAALCRRPRIHVAGYEDLWTRLARPEGVAMAPYDGLNVDTSMAALELAAAGYGAAIVLECFAEPYLAAGRLARAVPTILSMDQSHFILTAEGAKRQKPEIVLFRNWLKGEATVA